MIRSEPGESNPAFYEDESVRTTNAWQAGRIPGEASALPSDAERPGAAAPAEPTLRGPAHGSRVTPLSWLRQELAGYALPATLVRDATRPYVRVHLHGTAELTVAVERRDGRLAYVWGPIETTHPLADPAGCARRVATTLRRERGL